MQHPSTLAPRTAVRRRGTLILVLLMSTLTLARAQSIWTGGTSDWHTPTNWSTGLVPTATDDVVIPSAPANQPIISAAGAVARSVEVQSGATLTIQSTGTLAVNGSKNLSGAVAAFFDDGTVENSGQLLLGNVSAVGSYGIFNRGTFHNNAGGQITIDRSSSAGLFNFVGTFTNAALITIGAIASVGGVGLGNQATFYNNAGGQITIDRSTSVGLFNQAGTFTNEAAITIGATAGVGIYGLLNLAAFHNNAGGQITIDRSTDVSLYHQGGTFTNAATITIGATTGVGTYGLRNQATFYNNAGGQITIDRSTNSALLNTAGGTFTNAATLAFGATASVGFIGLSNQATFYNNAGGHITLDRSSDFGLFNYANTTFNNEATILIGSSSSVGGIGLANQGTFHNNVGGQITLDNASVAGLNNDIGTFENAASITIGANANLVLYGLVIQGGDFYNNSGGQISVDNSTIIGLWNIYGNFTNAASITIGAKASVGNFGLENQSIFTNSSCADLALFAPLSNNNSFTNAGLMTVSTTGAHSNTALTNDGVIAYPQGNPIPNVTNNALIASPIAGCDAIAPALAVGGSSPFTVGTTWYTDASKTQPAGTYDAATNTFSPASGLAGGQTHTLYFTVTTPACTQTVPIQVTINEAPQSTLDVSGPLDCNTPTVTLTAGGGVSYAFSGPGLAQSGPANTAPASQEGEYTVVVTGANGCTASATTSVSRTPDPGMPALSGVSLTVTASPTPVSLTQFVTADGGNTLSFYNSASQLLDPPTADISAPGQQTFSAVQTSAAGCSGPALFFTLTVESAATEPPLSQTVCRGSQVTLAVAVEGAAAYQWYETGKSANSKMSDRPGVQTGTATGNLTLLSVQKTSNYFCRVEMGDGSVRWLGQYNVTVDKSCSGSTSRLGMEEGEAVLLSITLLSNPIEGGQLRAVVRGAAGQPLTVEVYSLQGRLLGQQRHERAEAEQAVVWDLGAQPVGVYVLRAASNGQQQTVKVLRHPQ